MDELWNFGPDIRRWQGQTNDEGAKITEGLLLFVILARLCIWLTPFKLINATGWTVLMHWACTTHFGREQRGAVSALRGLTGCWAKWEGQQSFPGPGKRLVLGLQNCWLTLSDHTQTASFAVSHRLWSKIRKKGKWCVKIELRWEELGSNLTGNRVSLSV